MHENQKFACPHPSIFSHVALLAPLHRAVEVPVDRQRCRSASRHGRWPGCRPSMLSTSTCPPPPSPALLQARFADRNLEQLRRLVRQAGGTTGANAGRTWTLQEVRSLTGRTAAEVAGEQSLTAGTQYSRDRIERWYGLDAGWLIG